MTVKWKWSATKWNWLESIKRLSLAGVFAVGSSADGTFVRWTRQPRQVNDSAKSAFTLIGHAAWQRLYRTNNECFVIWILSSICTNCDSFHCDRSHINWGSMWEVSVSFLFILFSHAFVWTTRAGYRETIYTKSAATSLYFFFIYLFLIFSRRINGEKLLL